MKIEREEQHNDKKVLLLRSGETDQGPEMYLIKRFHKFAKCHEVSC